MQWDKAKINTVVCHIAPEKGGLTPTSLSLGYWRTKSLGKKMDFSHQERPGTPF